MGVTKTRMNTGPGDTWACDPCFYSTQTALALVKQHYKQGQRLKSKSQELLSRLKQHKNREAELLQEIKDRQRAQEPDCHRVTLEPEAQAGLENKLLQVQILARKEMTSLDEQSSMLETHLRDQRALYEHILDETGVIEIDDVRKSYLQHEEVQHEMKALSDEMARLGKLMQDFDGISRASDAALLSRHASLEKNRVFFLRNGPLESSRSEGSAQNRHTGHASKSDTEVPLKQSGARRSGFFQRSPRKVMHPVDATPTLDASPTLDAPPTLDATLTEEDSPPISRKRQRGNIFVEIERLQIETKKLEREAEESEVLLEVVTSLSQQSKEELAALQRVDVESILNSPSDDMSAESNVCTEASTIHTPRVGILIASASPSPEVLQAAEQSGDGSPEAGKLADEWWVTGDVTGTPTSEVLTTDSLDREDIQSVVKRIDFDNVDPSETCDMHSISSSVTFITENDIVAPCGGDCVDSDRDGTQGRHNTSEHIDETTSIDEEFVCEAVESSNDDEEDEDDTETFSRSTSVTEDEEDSNSVEDSDPEEPSSARTAERATSLLFSDHCSGNEQEIADLQDDGSKGMGENYDGTNDSRKENGSCSVRLDKRVQSLVSETHHLQRPLQDVQTGGQAESTKPPTEQLTQQVVLYADQVKEMRQTLDWFQENLRQEENNRQAAEQQSEQLSDLCADQALKLQEVGEQRDAFEKRWKELQLNLESKIKGQHKEDLAVEATIAASDSCTEDDCIPEWKLRENARNKLLEEQKRLLGDQLKEGERLRCNLEAKVLALRRQVEHLELSRQIAEEMGEMICYQNRAWKLAWRLTIQSFLFFLGVYLWLKNFRREVAVPLPT